MAASTSGRRRCRSQASSHNRFAARRVSRNAARTSSAANQSGLRISSDSGAGTLQPRIRTAAASSSPRSWLACREPGLQQVGQPERRHPIRIDARQVFDEMYGNKPECWSSGLTGWERLRFSINALTRMRVCTAEGCIDMDMKGKPEDARAPFRAWFAHENRRTADVRVIFGHWSAAGYINTSKLIGLDTGCVWGNLLTALNLDSDEPPSSVACTAHQKLPYANRVSDN